METLQELLFPKQFIPHGHCYLWKPALVRLHLMSDVLIAIAYFSIPIMLVYFVRKRKDVPFSSIFLLFGLFIVTCGTTHVMAVWTLWHPAYWLSGAIKAITAVVSLYTAFALFPTIPAALALPKPDALRQMNQNLKSEIEERKNIEATLQHQLAFDQLVSEISTRFINVALEDTDKEINQALKSIGQFVKVDTSYIFQYSAESDRFSMAYEWIQDGFTPQISHAQNLPRDAFPWGVQQLTQGDVLQVPSVANLPAAAAIDQQSLQSFGLQSLIAIPLMRQDALLGWVGLASFEQQQDWPYGNIQLLRLVAEIFNRAMQRRTTELALRQSETQLKASEERWQLALKGSNSGIWDWNVETDEVFYSIRSREMLGYDAHDFPDQVTEWEKRVHPDDIERVHAAVQYHFDNDTPFYQTEHRIKCKDGSYKWVLDRAKALRNETGQVIRMTGSHTDITDRKQAECQLQQLNQELEDRVEQRTAALKKSEQRFRSLFESAPDFIYLLDINGIIAQVNPTVIRESGYTGAELIGQPFLTFLNNPTEVVCCPEEFPALLVNGHHRQDLEFVQKDGRRLTMDSSFTVIGGEPSDQFVLVLQRDITERQRVEQMKAEFIAVVSHELRTPLTSIHGALDLLSGDLVSPSSERGQQVLSIAVDNSNRLVQLVNDILELERLEAGKIKLHPTSISTRDLLQRTYELMELMAERAKIRLDISQADVTIWADGDRLIQVLTNLIGNAIKFSEGHSTIWVTAQNISVRNFRSNDVIESVALDGTDGYVQFSVQDQGRGIPPEKLEHIFERFSQVDASDSRNKGGTGLGLAICRSIVEQHGGKIRVTSTVGKGSCFYFSIPNQCS